MLIAITRGVSSSIDRCELTHLERVPIDPALARAQHAAYERCLADLGCRVVSLPADAGLPDSVFVEDVAIVLDELAVITRPGAPSRRPETLSIEQALSPYRTLRKIEAPGTLDGGDVLRIGRMLYVGVSSRSDRRGIDQLHACVRPHGYTVRAVPIRDCLHLKSAVTLVGPDTLLLNPQMVDPAEFSGMRHVEVSPDEPLAANALLVGDQLIYPDTFPATSDRLARAGIRLRPVTVTELAKAEGGVTCCSLLLTLES